MIKEVKTRISRNEWNQIAWQTEGYSFADLSALVKDAAMGPVREVSGG